jgi:hypothetical protein
MKNHMKHLSPYTLFLPLLIVCAGCGSSGPPRAAVEGMVTVGGQPLSAGRIIFTPIAPNQGPSATARVSGGKYQLPKSTGAVIGNNRVEVEADMNLGFALDDEDAFAKRSTSLLPASPIPYEFGSNSKLSVDIKPGDVNKYDVPIPAAAQTVDYR